jgi:transposase-like protein
MAVGNASVVWQERLRRYARSGVAVAEFCDREGISAPSFYQWRRRLAEASARSRQKRSPPAHGGETDPVFRQVTLSGSGGVVAVELPSGVRLELPAENLPLVRAVVSELLQAEQTATLGGGGC